MNDVFETIESYLNGSMPEEERRLFEESLKNDPELAETFRLYKGIESTMQTSPGSNEQDQALKQSLSQLGKEHFKTKPAVTRKMFSAWQSAAAILIAVAIIALVMWIVRHNHEDDLFKKYAHYESVDPGTRSGSANDSLAIKAAAAYNTGNYTTALPLFENYIAKDSSDTEMYLALGVCYLETSKYDHALQLFNAIAAGKTVFVNQANWYKALTYLKQQNYAACKTILQTIPPDANVYQQAQSLLKDLQNTE